MPGSPEIIGSGTTPVRSDTRRLLLVKMVNAAGGGGGGGSGQILQVGVGGWAGPPAVPPNPTLPSVSYPSGGGGISEWDVPSQAWI